MADGKEREVMSLIKECISDIEECQADVIGDIAFKYNGITYRLKYDGTKEGVTIVPCDAGKYLEKHQEIFSKQENGKWNFNFSDLGKSGHEPVCVTLVPENSKYLKEYLDALAHVNKQENVLKQFKPKGK